MGRWNDAQRASRAQRIITLKLQVMNGILAQNKLVVPRCFQPGCGETENLAVDHPLGRKWNIRKHNEETRWRLYLRELERDVPLGLLCQDHSGRDGRLRFQGRPGWKPSTLDPFAAEAPWAITAAERQALREYLFGPLWIWEAA